MMTEPHRGVGNNAGSVFGILYAEDFDNPSQHYGNLSDQRPPEPPPAISQADVDAASAAAVRVAKGDWERGEERMRREAIASIAHVLTDVRNDAEHAAIAIAEATVTTILSVVTGLLPHFSREHGAAEVRALLDRLLPTIRSQTRINVRVHAELVTVIQSDIAELEPELAAMIDVVAAPLERGDAKVNWENGSMTRDTRKIMQAIEDALGQLGLQQPVEAPSKKRMAYAE